MNVLRNSIESIAGLRFVVNSLELASSPGRQALLETSWTSSRENILQRLEKVTRFYKYLEDEQSNKGLQELHLLLQDVRNIAGSITLLKERHSSCSDVDFYELKCLALVAAKVSRLAEMHSLQLEDMPSLTCTYCSYEIISGATAFIALLFSPLQDGSPPKHLSIMKS